MAEIEIGRLTSLRENWAFGYSGAEVLEGAEAKFEHHAERADRYRQMRDEVEAELQERGVELEVRHHSGGADVRAKADTELAERFNFAQNKLEEHEGKRDEYARWCRVLERNAEHTLRLAPADIEYFGL